MCIVEWLSNPLEVLLKWYPNNLLKFFMVLHHNLGYTEEGYSLLYNIMNSGYYTAEQQVSYNYVYSR